MTATSVPAPAGRTNTGTEARRHGSGRSKRRAARPDGYIITRSDQLAALASPVRFTLLEIACRMGPLTVAQMAHHAGRKPVSIYRHVRLLEDVGLLIEHEMRPVGRTMETLYRAVDRVIWYEYDAAKPRRTAILCDAVRTEMRLAERCAIRSLTDRTATTRGDDRDTHVGTTFAWLTPDELADVNRRINDLWTILHESSRRPGTTYVGVTLAQYPAPMSSDADDADV